jgi:hypothetical protein
MVRLGHRRWQLVLTTCTLHSYRLSLGAVDYGLDMLRSVLLAIPPLYPLRVLARSRKIVARSRVARSMTVVALGNGQQPELESCLCNTLFLPSDRGSSSKVFRISFSSPS